jgi:hypothetical protein
MYFPSCAPSDPQQTLDAFNEAIAAFNVQKFDEARSAIGKLQLDRLSPYERAKTEQILFQIAANQRNPRRSARAPRECHRFRRVGRRRDRAFAQHDPRDRRAGRGRH